MNTNAKKILKMASLSVLFIFLVGYALFNAKDLLFGVKIKNVEMVRGVEGEINIVKITGNAKNAKSLTLNGREISIDQQGVFNETIALLLGYNIITLKAVDKFGYSDEKDYKLTGTASR